MIEAIRQGLKADEYAVSIAKLYQRFNIPRRAVYYKPVEAALTISPKFAESMIKVMIEESSFFGYRTVVYLQNLNKNTMQCLLLFMFKGWQVKEHGIDFRPRTQVSPFLLSGRQMKRWPADLCRIWAGGDGWWATLALAIRMFKEQYFPRGTASKLCCMSAGLLAAGCAFTITGVHTRR